MIAIAGASVGYLSETVLTDFSASIDRGELVGVFGPNGAGKTTLLCAINGLARISRGTVMIDGRLLTARSARSIRTGIGYVPQYFEVDSRVPATAGEVVLMGAYGRLGLFRFPGRDQQHELRRVTEQVGIQHLLTKPFGQLSGGEKQRTLIARALIQRPRILLLDEVFSWVDMQMQAQLIGLLHDLHHRENLTTLIVSHNPLSIQSILTSAMYLEDGSLTYHGAPAGCPIYQCCRN